MKNDLLEIKKLSNTDIVKKNFFKIYIPKILSNLIVVTASFLNPRAKQKRFITDKELTLEEKKFIKESQTPDIGFREIFSNELGQKFKEISNQFERDGIIIFQNYFNDKLLKGMQEFFNEVISTKKIDPFFKQSSFRGSIDKNADLAKSLEMSTALTDPLMLAIVSYYLGYPVVLADWRGYRLEPVAPILYRAWDWHNDQKRKEVKMMILLSDVEIDGQAMQFIKGSQQNWWYLVSQDSTKYTAEEAVRLGISPAVCKCYGKAGSVLFFDTNGVHRGFRNLSERRDVLTFNFLPNRPGEAIFPLKSLHGNVLSEIKNTYLEIALRIKKNPDGEDPRILFVNFVKNHKQEIIDKLEKQGIINDEQDTDYFETKALIEEYNSTPKIEDKKPRYDPNIIDNDFCKFLTEIFIHDLGGDLDLPIRLGDGDVDRDLQFAKFRDYGPQSKEVKRLKERLCEVQLRFEFILQIPALQNFAKKICEIARTYQEDVDIRRCIKLAKDLETALGYCDNMQRLRTTLLQLYYTCDQINEIKPSEELEQIIAKILMTYAQIVYCDDRLYALYNENDKEKPIRQMPYLQRFGFVNNCNKMDISKNIPYLIDPRKHVKVWFSRDGIPDKHKDRIKIFRQLNHTAEINIIYAPQYMSPEGNNSIEQFAQQ